MSLQSTPSAERTQIALFGRRNAGKSSLMNAIAGQNLSIVSPQKGTTTDPVYKTMELLPLGPVMLIDTPGLDDEGELGKLRVERARQVLNKTDIALLVCDIREPISDQEGAFLKELNQRQIPTLLVLTHQDLTKQEDLARKLERIALKTDAPVYAVSSVTNCGVHELKQAIASLSPARPLRSLLDGLVEAKDVVVLVTPIDSAAPKGRLILPQQQVLRNLLDVDAIGLVTQPSSLLATLAALKDPPKLVITDSQVFAEVASLLDETIPLTSFSILFARYKGEFSQLLSGISIMDQLQDQDLILIAEGCTHHRQCDDIGTVKIPRWLQQSTKKSLQIHTCAGGEFPLDLSKYKLVIHCGGCMLPQREIASRLDLAKRQQIPIVNYGIFIAYVTGILERAIAPLSGLEEA